jgi:organic radical activating enzyme
MTVIFPDKNIGPRYFKSAPDDSLLVRTIFPTLQGEGPFAGRPAIFLRLGGCNLGAKDVGAPGCAWCDTDFRIAESTYMTIEEILAKVKELTDQYPIPPIRQRTRRSGGEWLIVVTGGEPMLQKNLVKFCEQALVKYGVQIETNGMYYLDLPDGVITVMSPKVGGAKAKHYPWPNQNMLVRADHLKFVLTADPKSVYHEIPGYAFTLAQPVWVSPMAVYKRPMSVEEGERASAWDATLIDQEATAANYLYASQYALKHGLRCSIQQHLFYAMP